MASIAIDGVRKDVIGAGRLNTLLHNLKTAHKQGVATTANASRPGYAAPVGVGVRVWSGPLAIDEVQTVVGHKPFRLINLPFYLLGNLETLVRRYL